MILISGMLCSRNKIELDLKELLKNMRRKGNPVISLLFLKFSTYGTVVYLYNEF